MIIFFQNWKFLIILYFFFTIFVFTNNLSLNCLICWCQKITVHFGDPIKVKIYYFVNFILKYSCNDKFWPSLFLLQRKFWIWLIVILIIYFLFLLFGLRAQFWPISEKKHMFDYSCFVAYNQNLKFFSVWGKYVRQAHILGI